MNKMIKRGAVALGVALLLGGCGGGGDAEAGSLEEFNVTPDTFGYESPAGSPSCMAGTANDRFIISGGAAPYTVESTSPGIVTTSTEKVSDRGGHFTVSFTGACTKDEGVTILITDKLGRTKTVTVANVLAS